MVIKCTQEKGTGALLFLGEGNRYTTVLRRRNWCSTVLRIRDMVLYCSQETETGALLFSGEGKRCSTVFKRKEQGHYRYQKETNALLFSRRRKLVLYCLCFKEKGTGVLQFSVEGNWCTQHYCFQDRRRKQVLYCF